MRKLFIFGPALVVGLIGADLGLTVWRIAKADAAYDYSPLGSCTATGAIVTAEIRRSWVLRLGF